MSAVKCCYCRMCRTVNSKLLTLSLIGLTGISRQSLTTNQTLCNILIHWDSAIESTNLFKQFYQINKGLIHYNLINIKIHYYLHGLFTNVSILNQLRNWK